VARDWLITTYQVEWLGVASIGIVPVLTNSQRLKEVVSCLSGIAKGRGHRADFGVQFDKLTVRAATERFGWALNVEALSKFSRTKAEGKRLRG
jgi:hypothetical protein